MNVQATKTPLLIAAIATAVTLTSLSPASAQPLWASATTDTETAQVFDANFKVKLKKHKLHHGYKFHGHKHHGVKKKYVSPKTKFKKKVLIKKFF
ncbi:hypothetical protein [Tateyamaria omphalii]|uniref:Uncharacterized protein n=1 Tax=Tateyamaria omphalii TaxID=299262 RepID=A0A1P8MX93_9RHOB|nr:hypothetical protein [Tateyamaria omphalii]APX12623.1 hypothetical protein BWR18_13715 [Tateyamaria omphalii]